ncbi:hypothetical protein J2S11_002301 [Bacillus horti]|uniref:Uncharacterized protein n=1 Tax=Caldalkalibacillus horti TaxID=77523 RepID=A0ABT9VZZ9_9BACI|nr:hypothetical protein [Bacillus horti]
MQCNTVCWELHTVRNPARGVVSVPTSDEATEKSMAQAS